MGVPTANLDGRERSRARITIILLTLLLAVFFVELFTTPFVVTVYSKGCWSVNTDGIFSRFNVRGCGTQSWLMVDLYAHVSTQPVSNGANDVSLFLTSGAGPGGGCLGGSACSHSNLFTYVPPSPVACKGCTVTQLGLPNPLADWGSSNFAMFPFITWILLVYIAWSIRSAPRVYSGYLRSERASISWKDLSDRRKALAIFALGYFALATYQYLATWFYLFFQPIPTLTFPFVGILIIPVAVWISRFLGWRFPAKALSYSNVVSSSSSVSTKQVAPCNMRSPIEHLPARGVAEAHEFCIRLKVGPRYERGLPITGFRFSNYFFL